MAFHSLQGLFSDEYLCTIWVVHKLYEWYPYLIVNLLDIYRRPDCDLFGKEFHIIIVYNHSWAIMSNTKWSLLFSC